MKLNTKRTILVGLAFLSISAFWQLYDSIIPLILKNTFHISDTVSGGIMAMDNVLALFMLPFFGSLSDKVHTRLGRRTPFILCGTAAAVIAMLFLPFADNIVSLGAVCDRAVCYVGCYGGVIVRRRFRLCRMLRQNRFVPKQMPSLI